MAPALSAVGDHDFGRHQRAVAIESAVALLGEHAHDIVHDQALLAVKLDLSAYHLRNSIQSLNLTSIGISLPNSF